MPAFCRTRRPITTTVRVSSLQQLLWLQWLVLALQLSTILLLLAGPLSAPTREQADAPLTAAAAAASAGSGAVLPSSSSTMSRSRS